MQAAWALGEFVPGKHARQLGDPVEGWYVPEPQLVQAPADGADEYVPALQFVHVVATAGLKVPAAHALHDDELATEKVPAVQLEHTLAFSFE